MEHLNHSVTRLFVRYSGHHSAIGQLLTIQLPDVSDNQMPTIVTMQLIESEVMLKINFAFN